MREKPKITRKNTMKIIPPPTDQQLLKEEPPLARLIPDHDLFHHLQENIKKTFAQLQYLTEAQLLFRYAPGKYSIKETLLHMTDMERIYSYRILRTARNDQTPMEGFDAEVYVKTSGADSRNIKDLLDEFASQRKATISLLQSMPEKSLTYTGLLYGIPVTISALAYHIAGHELHHLEIIRTRYLNNHR